jgi:hypothetical protein
MPVSPMLVLSLVIATLYAALFHLLGGKTMRDLGVTWLAAVVGFAVGQVLASALGWADPMIGELHLLAASAASWLAMALARRAKL